TENDLCVPIPAAGDLYVSRRLPMSSFPSLNSRSSFGHGLIAGTCSPRTVCPAGSSHSRPCMSRNTPRPAGTWIGTVLLSLIFCPFLTDSSLLPVQSFTNFQYPFRSRYTFQGLVGSEGFGLAGSACLIVSVLNVTLRRVGAGCCAPVQLTKKLLP